MGQPMTTQNTESIGVGVIGCGTISPQYFRNMPLYPGVEIVACSDLILDRAKSRAQEFGVPKACSVEELLSDPNIDIVLNLTTPNAHAEVSLAAIAAEKHVYNEKPLTIDRDDGEAILSASRSQGVRVGCAPDTFLGGGIQTCRRLIDAGDIGRPFGATAFFANHGHESWHPDPAFYYQRGGGPMFDMGPYYLTCLVALLGPVQQVSGSYTKATDERTITSEARYGEKINVEVPTHVTGLLNFDSGAVATVITSFDVWASELPRIEIYGAERTLSVPDPNIFGGPVRLKRGPSDEWTDVALTHPEGGRGLGVADMAQAIRRDRKSRADAELANHVLDIMHAIHESSEQGSHVNLTSKCQRPEAIPPGLPLGEFDA
ncbi:MAG: Gfo/Idh/MocA family oxidoreductase [SAR202 cluster bacterium]|jgi:predicted dehydrogenase|nr:Gfo/Idh/MocA family oxidoreductase [SAR202 cluster bacterium]